MKKLKAKLPFGACVNAKVAFQSCSSRWSDTTCEANSRFRKSYVVLHWAAHFGVIPKLVFDCSVVIAGVRKSWPPPVVVRPLGSTPGSSVPPPNRCAKVIGSAEHCPNPIGSLWNGAQIWAPVRFTTFVPTMGRWRVEEKLKLACHPWPAGGPAKPGSVPRPNGWSPANGWAATRWASVSLRVRSSGDCPAAGSLVAPPARPNTRENAAKIPELRLTAKESATDSRYGSNFAVSLGTLPWNSE